MKRFLNLRFNVVEKVNNNLVAEQYRKRTDLFKELSDDDADDSKSDVASTKSVSLNELKKQAKALGIDYKKNVTKAELQALIDEANN